MIKKRNHLFQKEKVLLLLKLKKIKKIKKDLQELFIEI